MGRREKQREITREEIKALARQQMAADGTAALSLGGIARAMELTPSALYRYYASRDELITALIVDAYTRLADALEASTVNHAPGDYAGRMFATGLAYREWALAQPVDFLLIFGNPIPGYQAPGDETMLPAHRVFAAFLNVLQQAYDVGVLKPSDEHHAMAERACYKGPLPPQSAISHIEPLVSYVGVTGWAKIHGMTMLELTHHLPGISDPEAFYRSECRLWALDVGLAVGPVSAGG
ncbi:MAG: TetR/AcrR family transcriptional regulator [Chloroflexales bacterium]|nr:TetR/AcrR family transcriptional regulator [Chloroflexales bacterium]